MEWKPSEIKALRQALGLTQAEFSKKCLVVSTTIPKVLSKQQKKFSLSQGLVAQWETGKKSPTEDGNKILEQLRNEIPTDQKPSFLSAPLEIKALREALGLTRAELAKKLKISKCLVKYWEKGKRSPSPKFWAKLKELTLQADKINAEGEQNVTSEEGGQIITSEEGGQIITSEEGGQIITSEEGGQIITSDEQEQIITSDEGEEIVTSSESLSEQGSDICNSQTEICVQTASKASSQQVSTEFCTQEEGEQNVTSEEGEQIVTSEEQDFVVTSENESITLSFGGQAENIAHLNCKEAALEYLSYGWSVIPLCPPDCSPDKVPWHWRDKDGKQRYCAHPGKVPLVAWTVYQERLPTALEVEQWFSKWPFANVGIVTGRVSKLLVVDFDDPKAIDAINEFGGFPKTPEVKTGGSGQHNYFQHPSEGLIANFAGKLKDIHPSLEKVDLRADGGQVVAPPSLHVSGNRYVWTVPPNEVSPPDLPKWFIDLLEQKPLGLSIVDCRLVARLPKQSEKQFLQSSIINQQSSIKRLPDNFLVLKKCDSLIKSLWSNESLQVSKKGGPETSDYDWALGRACIERGIRNRDDLATILAHFPHGKYARDLSDYNLALTVEKLMQTIPHKKKEDAEKVLANMSQQLNIQVPQLKEREVLVLRATPGLGKTTEIIEVIRNSERKVILAEPTKEMARTVFEQFSYDASLLEGRSKENCMRYSQVELIAAKGYMPGKVICPGCPYSPSNLFSNCCEYFRQFFNPTRVKVTTYEQALELHFAGKLNADLIVLDEDPSRALFKKVEITANQLHFPKDSKYPLPTFGRLIRDTLHEAEEKAAGQTLALRCREVVSLLKSVAKKRRIKLTKHLRLVSSCIENVFDQPARLESLKEEEIEALPHAYVGELAKALLSEIDKASEFGIRNSEFGMSCFFDKNFRNGCQKNKKIKKTNPQSEIRNPKSSKRGSATALSTPGDIWNSRLTLVVSGGRARYIMREVRQITVRTPIVVLDAYANKDYYRKLFKRGSATALSNGRDVKFLMFDAQSHCEVMTIPLNTSKNAFLKRKENLVDDLAAVVYRFNGRKILVYTYLFLKEDVEKMFPFVAVEHFWSGRGKDCWRDYDIVIIFGTPEPNPSELFDDARALYADDENPISLAQSESDPRKYADSRLQLLREMRREDEIMQDVHRIRPIWGKGLDKKVVIMSQLYCPQLPPDKIVDPKTIDKKSAHRELRKERLRQLIEACIKEYGFYFDGFAVAAGLIKTTGGGVCMQGFDGVGECMDTGLWQVSYKNILIRESPQTSNDAGSASYGGSKKEYIANRDAILAELGAKEARMSVFHSGVWRPYKIWGNLDAAKAFFAVSLPAGCDALTRRLLLVNSEVEKQQSEEEKAPDSREPAERDRREYEAEVRRELDEEILRYKDTLDYEEPNI